MAFFWCMTLTSLSDADSSEAVKPMSCIWSMMSRGPVTSGSYVKRPLHVERATEAEMIPACFTMDDSMRCTHDAHVMPSTCGGKEGINYVFILKWSHGLEVG